MALASFKDLCIDASDLVAVTQFWSPTLGLTIDESDDPSITRLDGATRQHTVWINKVPEPKTAKNRVHLDVHAADPDAIEGASPLSGAGDYPWRIMTDPDGGEFCVFTRDAVPDYRLYEVVVDAADPQMLAEWWATVFGAEHHISEQGWHSVDHVAEMPFDCFVFNAVPEPKTVKNRIHWDIEVDTAEGIDALTAHGATILRRPDDRIRWTIMADPEGNEFCAFVR